MRWPFCKNDPSVPKKIGTPPLFRGGVGALIKCLVEEPALLLERRGWGRSVSSKFFYE